MSRESLVSFLDSVGHVVDFLTSVVGVVSDPVIIRNRILVSALRYRSSSVVVSGVSLSLDFRTFGFFLFVDTTYDTIYDSGIFSSLHSASCNPIIHIFLGDGFL